MHPTPTVSLGAPSRQELSLIPTPHSSQGPLINDEGTRSPWRRASPPDPSRPESASPLVSSGSAKLPSPLALPQRLTRASLSPSTEPGLCLPTHTLQAALQAHGSTVAKSSLQAPPMRAGDHLKALKGTLVQTASKSPNTAPNLASSCPAFSSGLSCHPNICVQVWSWPDCRELAIFVAGCTRLTAS